MIKLTNLNKYYNKGQSTQIHVINDANLELPNTSLVSILGESGSGKSTLLNVIGGLDSASGNINYFDELLVDKYTPSKVDAYRNNNIGYIFQNYNLIPELTVYENLAFALELIGVTDKTEVNQKIDEALDLVNMRRYKRRNALALSGGQQQRVSIARAIIKGAKVLIADEPTGNLDSRNTIDVMNILKSLSSSCLVLLVTHDKEVAYKYSDRIISLADGVIVDDKNYDNKSLVGHDDVLYLSDYDKTNYGNDKSYLNIYSNDSTDVGVNLYVKDNVVYVDVKSSLPTKVIGLNSNLEIKDVKPEQVEVQSVNIDLFMNKSGNDHKVKYSKYFLSKMWMTFKSFFNIGLKMRTLYLAFMVVGILICANFASINSNLYVSPDYYISGTNEAIYIKDGPDDQDFMWSSELEDIYIEQIDNNSSNNNNVSGIYVPIVTSRYVEVDEYFTIFHQQQLSNLKYSEPLGDDEILITTLAAEYIFEEINNYSDFSMEDLIGTNIYTKGEYYTIVGIEDIEIDGLIISVDNYLKRDSTYNQISEDINRENSKVVEMFFTSTEEDCSFQFYLADDIESLGGSITVSDSLLVDGKINIYVNSEVDTDEIEFIDKEDANYIVDDGLASCIDCVFFDSAEDYGNYLLQSGAYLNSENNQIFYRSDYELTSGTAPVFENEIVIADIFKDTTYETKMKETYSVTGYYKYEYQFIPAALTSLKQYNDLEIYNNSIFTYDYIYPTELYVTNDLDKVLNYLLDNGYEAYYYRDYIIDTNVELLKEENMVQIVITSIILGVAVLFIFFIGRSKMLAKIKNIGIYRALGSSKSLILISFIAEGIVLATFTIGLGYVGTYWIICSVSDKISYALPYVFNFGYFLIGLGGIYILTIVASSLPVIVLLRKTPIEIIGKYDI